MKFTVNGNEIEMERGFFNRMITFSGYYHTITITLGDYTVEVLEEDLGLALSNIDSIDKFKEFVNTYDGLDKVIAKEEEYFSTYKEAKEEEEEEEEEEGYIIGKGFYRGRKK